MIRYEVLNVFLLSEFRNFLENVLLTKCESDERKRIPRLRKWELNTEEKQRESPDDNSMRDNSQLILPGLFGHLEKY